jgi:EAL domain-containing protein (putative c-di-GMP-specific phosphodiesterase class I)
MPEDYSLVAELLESPAHVVSLSGHWLLCSGETRVLSAVPIYDDEQRFRGALLLAVDRTEWNDYAQLDLCGRLAPYLPALIPLLLAEGGVDGMAHQTPLSVEWLDEALRTDGFELHLQPIVPLRDTNEPACVEVLLRLRAIDGSLIPPHEFLGAAEQHGRIEAIDRWVLRVLLGWMRRNPRRWQRTRTVFAINLSAVSIASAEFLRYVELCLDKAEIPAQALRFEIAAAAANHAPAAFTRLARALIARGAEIAVDDAIGVTDELAFLRGATARYLKIDGDLVNRAPEDQLSRAVLTGIVHMAGSLGMKTVAERVESPAALAAAHAAGVDFAQGYALQRPQSIDTFRFGAGTADPKH